MSAFVTNQAQMRLNIFSGSPKKNPPLPIVLEHERRNQARRRQQMPEHEEPDQHAGLPDAQVRFARFQVLPHGRIDHAASCCR